MSLLTDSPPWAAALERAAYDALERWVSCPGLAPARQLAQQIVWIVLDQSGRAA